MANAHLARYLNDHLAGSVVVLELLPHLAQTYAGTEKEPFFTNLHTEVSTDREALEGFMQRLEVAESSPRQAAAWLTEKVTQIKLRTEDRDKGAFYLLEALEIILVGVQGKRSLWQTLAAADLPELSGTDYKHWEQRALEQMSSLDEKHQEAARTAFR